MKWKRNPKSLFYAVMCASYWFLQINKQLLTDTFASLKGEKNYLSSYKNSAKDIL